ncbi:MAG: segregation/condensation protein A [Fusobacteriaceae bacterium]|jgi:segregation and condensation protein A|nr:segregation/condensation protein A [Fusobacteriaceae bacterium]
MENIFLKLDNFEGPLDLLLELINKKKLKIAEIRISQIIDDYLEIISQAQEDNLDIKSEFLVIAAELLEIKSEEIIGINTELNKEKEFKQRLEDYAIFRELTKELGELENEYNVSYSRTGGRKIMAKPLKEYDIGSLQPLDLFKVYAARLEENKEELMDLDFDMDYSINEVAKVLYLGIKDKIRTFNWVFDRAENIMHLIYLFLSILELYKDGYIFITSEGIQSVGREWIDLSVEEEKLEQLEAKIEKDAKEEKENKENKEKEDREQKRLKKEEKAKSKKEKK